MVKSRLLLEDDPKREAVRSQQCEHNWVYVSSSDGCRVFQCVECGKERRLPLQESTDKGRLLLG